MVRPIRITTVEGVSPERLYKAAARVFPMPQYEQAMGLLRDGVEPDLGAREYSSPIVKTSYQVGRLACTCEPPQVRIVPCYTLGGAPIAEVVLEDGRLTILYENPEWEDATWAAVFLAHRFRDEHVFMIEVEGYEYRAFPNNILEDPDMLYDDGFSPYSPLNEEERKRLEILAGNTCSREEDIEILRFPDGSSIFHIVRRMNTPSPGRSGMSLLPRSMRSWMSRLSTELKRRLVDGYYVIPRSTGFERKSTGPPRAVKRGK